MHGARLERYTLPAAAVSAIVAAIWSSWPVRSFISIPSREGASSAICFILSMDLEVRSRGIHGEAVVVRRRLAD